MNDLISVIVPVYKVEKYLTKCIDSIINQTYKNLQIILVDDGSPDNCGKICDSYAKKDKRIRVIHKKNGGLSDARNAGIESAKGEYLAFIDSDDYIAPDMLEKLHKALTDADADMSICSFKYIWEDASMTDEELNNSSPIKNEVLYGRDILCNKMNDKGGWYWVVAWNKLYRKELFNDVCYPNNKIHEDEFVIHKILFKCDKVVCIEDMLYYYFQRQSSIMNEKYSIKRLDAVEALLDRVEFMIEHQCYNGVFKCYMKAKLYLCLGYENLDTKNPETRKRLKKLKRKFVSLYKIIPKKLSDWKEIIHINAFILTPKLYLKYLSLRNHER